MIEIAFSVFIILAFVAVTAAAVGSSISDFSVWMVVWIGIIVLIVWSFII